MREQRVSIVSVRVMPISGPRPAALATLVAANTTSNGPTSREHSPSAASATGGRGLPIESPMSHGTASRGSQRSWQSSEHVVGDLLRRTLSRGGGGIAAATGSRPATRELTTPSAVAKRVGRMRLNVPQPVGALSPAHFDSAVTRFEPRDEHDAVPPSVIGDGADALTPAPSLPFLAPSRSVSRIVRPTTVASSSVSPPPAVSGVGGGVSPDPSHRMLGLTHRHGADIQAAFASRPHTVVSSRHDDLGEFVAEAGAMPAFRHGDDGRSALALLSSIGGGGNRTSAAHAPLTNNASFTAAALASPIGLPPRPSAASPFVGAVDGRSSASTVLFVSDGSALTRMKAALPTFEYSGLTHVDMLRSRRHRKVRNGAEFERCATPSGLQLWTQRIAEPALHSTMGTTVPVHGRALSSLSM